MLEVDPKCYVCVEIIDFDDEFVTASNNMYHMDCFVCSYCFRSLVDEEYYEFDSHLFCEEHYVKLYAPTCNICDKGITGSIRLVKQYSFHTECFVCITCRCDLENGGCVCTDDGTLLCANCHDNVDKFVGNCETCNEPLVEGDYLLYKGSYVHPHHHRCFTCHSLLKKGAIYHNETLYCKKCYDFKIAKICCVCKTSISGISILVDERYYHPNHFNCSVCDITLKAEQFYSIKNYMFCKTHYNQFFVTPCFICGEGDADKNTKLYGKFHCPKHKICYHCLRYMEDKTNVVEYDNKPICETCYKDMSPKVKKVIRKIFTESKNYNTNNNNNNNQSIATT